MKITSLLAQYLHTHHRLALPGIGRFTVEPIQEPVTTGKAGSTPTEQITFEYQANIPDQPELVAYISEQTGKMKALASSDLDSFIELAQQFLNIGKPFTFDGIGTLVKLKPGEYEFAAAVLTPGDRKKETTREIITSREETVPRFDSIAQDKPSSIDKNRKSIIALLLLIGIGAAVWVGYKMSQKNQTPASSNDTTVVAPESSEPTTTVVNDSLPQTATADGTSAAAIITPEHPQGFYKYVLETAGKNRAIKRYNQLIENRWKVQLETTDSVSFKLFMMLPHSIGDSSRVKDSLRILTGRPVRIEL